MDLLIAFLIFIISVVGVLILDQSLIIAMLIGLVVFWYTGMRRGGSFHAIGKAAMASVRDSLIVIKVMLIIGLLTGIWRTSGTITISIYYGLMAIRPQLFLIVTFLLCCLLSYALGTSFGVAATVGVIFMALARSGGVDPLVTAGTIFSGVYFGDRCSPVSSSANMVAGITGTKIYDNVKWMMKTGAVPFLLTLGIYSFLSFRHPLSAVDESLRSALSTDFSLSLWSFLPAVLMLLLPLFKVSVIRSITASIVSAVLVSYFVQGAGAKEILTSLLIGYDHPESALGTLLKGGGLTSMLEVVILLIISSMYSGIFRETKMLDQMHEKLAGFCKRFGRFHTMTLTSIVVGGLFCNQTISILMCRDLLQEAYERTGGTSQEFAIDMENSVILICCFIPWAVGAMVPRQFLGVGVGCMVYAVYMYLVPLTYWFLKPVFAAFRSDRRAHVQQGN